MMTTAFATSPEVAPLNGLAHFDRPTYLMCPPEFYDVNYVINPWMAGNLHRPSRDAAFAQWRNLHRALKRIADVRLLPALPAAPDMVFVAHTALVSHGVAALSSFAHPQRQVEEGPMRRWFRESGFLVWETPRETAFEGEGDAMFDQEGNHLWIAHGVRTCKQSHRHVADAWHTPVTSLNLVDPRFFHLDTCFAPLADGYLLYFPGAFDRASLAKIEAAYPAERRITVSEAEATHFACSVINVGRNILMGSETPDLAARLADFGFDATTIDLSEFHRGGGSAKSLALRLSDPALSVR
ncbi:MAG: amidinotransferase [Acidobacteriota bacterium]|nr:amidinotransferase [Acidobacteriota bacterium]